MTKIYIDVENFFDKFMVAIVKSKWTFLYLIGYTALIFFVGMVSAPLIDTITKGS